MIEQTVADAVDYETVDLVVDDHATAGISRHWYHLVRGGRDSWLLLCGGTHVILGSREKTGVVLCQVIGSAVDVKLFSVRCSISSYFAAELHAREWTRRLIFTLRLLDRGGQVLGTRQYLLIIDLFDIGRNVEILVRLVGNSEAAMIHFIGHVRHLQEPMLLPPGL